MKRILVALDSSDRAPRVLEAARRLAEYSDGTLVLFRAITVPYEFPRSLGNSMEPRLEDMLLRRANEDLQQLASLVPKQLVERIATDFATPWDGICRAAREYDVDLIAIGSHGYGALDHLLGTTAAKVVNHADRNVLVVRTPL